MGRPLTRWMFSAASVIGRSHENGGAPCQDAAGGQRAGAVTAVALADGAGSAPRSDLGARTAVSAALELLPSAFDDLYQDGSGAGARILGAVVSRLSEAAAASAATISELACTLLFVAVKHDRFIAGQVGDGIIACERGGRREVISRPQRGEHANETVFVTSRAAAAALALERGHLDGVTAFAIMSDGSAESLYLRRDGVAAPALTSMWRWLDDHAPEVVGSALEANLRDQLRQSTGDDCSLALLRRVSLAPERLPAMDAAFTRAFLDCRSARGVQNRLAVLTALRSAEPPPSLTEVSARSSLSVSTVRRHARYLKALAW